jgi:AcrR family transcriptional regulator
MPSRANKSDLIIQNALEILGESGASALTMRGLADRCGISLGNLQYHFKTREALLEGLLEFFLTECARMSREYLEGLSGTPEENLKQLTRFNLENPLLVQWSGIFQELRAMGRHDPEINRALREYYTAWRDQVVEHLQLMAPKAGRAELRNAAGLLLTFVEGYGATRDYMSVGTGRMTQAVMDYARFLLNQKSRR